MNADGKYETQSQVCPRENRRVAYERSPLPRRNLPDSDNAVLGKSETALTVATTNCTTPSSPTTPTDGKEDLSHRRVWFLALDGVLPVAPFFPLLRILLLAIHRQGMWGVHLAHLRYSPAQIEAFIPSLNSSSG